MAADDSNSFNMQSSSASIISNLTEPISDDQELFLKVLENLKNAVTITKVDCPVSQTEPTTTVFSPKEGIDLKVMQYGCPAVTLPGTLVSRLTPGPQSLVRSEIEEPGTTTVTVSDKTKSLILQKLAIASDKSGQCTAGSSSGVHTELALGPVSHIVTVSAPSHTVANVAVTTPQMITSANSIATTTSVENVVLSVMGINSVTGAVTQKNMVSARPVTKDNTSKPADKYIHTVGNTFVTQKQPSVQLFPCTYCDYYSENKSYLKQHLDYVHRSERPYKCPYCDYAGKRSHALREHLIVHTDDRPFQCKICKATFRKKGHLTNHIKLHNSKRLVKCPLCKALVYDTGENGLDAHLKNDHDTDRLFGCDLCDHVAANEPDILKHLGQKHKSKLVTYKCDRCPFETANGVDFNAHTKCHDLAEMEVEINSKAPTSVIGVATIPVEYAQSTGTPQLSTVRLTSKPDNAGGNTSSSPRVPQAAVVKPVWIKCSECGFVEQDSEVIKSHMLEHLKEQFGNEYVHQIKDDASRPTATPSPDLVEKQVIKAAITQEKLTAAQSSNTPILVPVTNVDSLLSQHTGKIDMNSPILVPVTDPSVLKTLQSQTGILPQAPKTSSLSLNREMTVTSGKSTAEGQGVKFVVTTSTVVSDSVPRPTVLSQMNPVLQTYSDKTTALPLQTIQLENLLKNPNLKVIPLSDKSVLPTSITNSPQQTIMSLATIPASAQNTILVTGGQRASPSNPALPTLTKIPVPRNIPVDVTPKLPPEFATQSTDENNDIETTSPPTEVEMSKEQKLVSLRENLAKVKKLIQEQEKLSKQIGNAPIVRLTAEGIPEKINVNGVVYYVDSIEKMDTSVSGSLSFTHDSTAGRFKCTLCGYTCEYQRTIKAHIWKHSGNKQVDYPMFQNGPLSVYEGEGLPVPPNPTKLVKLPEVSFVPTSVRNIEKVQSVTLSEPSGAGSLPGFIVYENQSRISNVAPALANKIVSKQNVESTVVDHLQSVDETLSEEFVVGQSEKGKISHVAPALANLIVARTIAGMTDDQMKQNHGQGTEDGEDTKQMDTTLDDCKLTIDESDIGSNVSIPVMPAQNVVVETVESVANCGLTAMALQSQQNSPRISTRSPDSGLSEMTSSSRPVDEGSFTLTASDGTIVSFSQAMDDTDLPVHNLRKRTTRSCSASESIKKKIGDSVKKARFEEAREDSAVTLLSLLKKGPNYNPACPPKQQAPVAVYSNVSSPGQEDSNSIGENDGTGGKPKLGISTSLLAVIEQLRERSKSDIDEDKPVVPPAKKQYKRRSRKSSIEDNTPASGIANVEEFVKAGEVKYRCKLCHYTNESTLLLRQHMKLHKPKQQFECSLCDLIAESSEALQDHMIQHCKVRTYQCKLCNSTFNYKSQLRAHMRMHNDQDILMCAFCDFETRNTAAFKLHLKSHATKPPYKCSMCNEEFVTSQNLRNHKRDSCTGGLDRGASSSYACDECDFVCVGRREIKNHQRTHMGKAVTNVPKKCPYCEHTDVTIEQIRKHISEVHGESKPLKCNMCGFVAVSIRSLKSHMKRHVNDQRFVAQPLEQYKCDLCGYVCHHLPSLKSHMWRHASDLHYSYEFTNDIINAAIDFDSITEVTETTETHVENFRRLIYDKMKAKGLGNARESLDDSAKVCCWVTFRCCQCGFETINKAELNKHMSAHTDIIKMTLDITDDGDSGRQSQDEVELRST